MQIIDRSKKQRKTDGATINSRQHMKGMYDYSDVTHRVYQTEKRTPSGDSRYTRIRSKEELKHDADLTVTVTNIRRAEKYLDPDGQQTPVEKVEEKYGLKYDEKELKSYGDSVDVFQKLCEKYPMAKNYVAWNDLYLCMNDRKPLRTTPVKVTKVEPETGFASDVEHAYQKGDLLWTIYREHVKIECDRCYGRGRIAADGKFISCPRCEGTGVMESKTETRPAVASGNVVSWYTKKLGEGKYDIMYELDGHGAFGKTRDRNGNEVDASAWRLQSGGNLFETEEAALKFLEELE